MTQPLRLMSVVMRSADRPPQMIEQGCHST
jgi:hypothetical protein